MALLDAPARAAAQTAINLVGTSVELTNRTMTYAAGSLSTTPTETTVQVKGSFQEWTDEELANGIGGNETVKTSDRKLLVDAVSLEAKGFVPAGEGIGFLKYRGAEYRILAVKETLSGDQVALYTLQARR